MAFDIANDQRIVSINNPDDPIFDGMYTVAVGAAFSIFPQIHAGFYGSFTITVVMLPQFRQEIKRLIEFRQSVVASNLMREHQVTAQTPEILEPIMAGLLARDDVYAKLNELLSLCDDSLTRQQPITCLGD